MTDLTTRQQRVFDFIQAEAEAGRPVPTLREIAKRQRRIGPTIPPVVDN
jgi:hypothetical protein